MESRFYQIPETGGVIIMSRTVLMLAGVVVLVMALLASLNISTVVEPVCARHLQVDRRRCHDPCRLYGQGQEDLAVLSRLPAREDSPGCLFFAFDTASNSEVRQQALSTPQFQCFRISEAVCKVLCWYIITVTLSIALVDKELRHQLCLVVDAACFAGSASSCG
jgi:hypothetical protein